jgi:adenylate cyclase
VARCDHVSLMSEFYDALVALGIGLAEIEAAESNGTLLALTAEHVLLPGERKLDVAEVAARCGVEPETLASLWLALGFPRAVGEKVFTDNDVDVLRTFLRSGSISDYSLHEVRIISASLGRVADVIVDEIWDAHRSTGQSEQDALTEMADGVDLDRMELILMYLLRRHLVSGFYRRSALHDQAMRFGSPSMAVGFADLAGFSTFSQAISGAELASLIVEFERTVYDLVAELDSRVVKTMGDGVLFTSDSPQAAADIALRLTGIGDELPPVHVGVGWGPVLVRQGDCFGPTVNLVSRLVGCAAGREVVIDASMATQLADDDRFAVVPLGDRDLKSFGPVPLFRLARPTPTADR